MIRFRNLISSTMLSLLVANLEAKSSNLQINLTKQAASEHCVTTHLHPPLQAQADRRAQPYGQISTNEQQRSRRPRSEPVRLTPIKTNEVNRRVVRTMFTQLLINTGLFILTSVAIDLIGRAGFIDNTAKGLIAITALFALIVSQGAVNAYYLAKAYRTPIIDVN